MKTSVLIEAGSRPGACQNSELVVGSGSMITSHFRLESAFRTWLESGPMEVAVIPERITPSIFPFSAWSKIEIHEALLAGFGIHLYMKSLSAEAASPYQFLSRLTKNF